MCTGPNCEKARWVKKGIVRSPIRPNRNSCVLVACLGNTGWNAEGLLR